MEIFGIDLTPVWLSFRLATLTSVILFLMCFFLAYVLARFDFAFKSLLDGLLSLPLVLPPTVLGFYLLLAFSPNSFLGQILQRFDLQLLFSFSGLLVASVIYSLPFMLGSLRSGFELLDDGVLLRARLLGKSHFYIITRIALRQMVPSILLGFTLSFAHTLGEFGVVIMIGGSIAGQTKVVSIAMFEAIESMDYASAHAYAVILLGFSLVVLIASNILRPQRMAK